jgi:hypothetical protein
MTSSPGYVESKARASPLPVRRCSLMLIAPRNTAKFRQPRSGCPAFGSSAGMRVRTYAPGWEFLHAGSGTFTTGESGGGRAPRPFGAAVRRFRTCIRERRRGTGDLVSITPRAGHLGSSRAAHRKLVRGGELPDGSGRMPALRPPDPERELRPPPGRVGPSGWKARSGGRSLRPGPAQQLGTGRQLSLAPHSSPENRAR